MKISPFLMLWLFAGSFFLSLTSCSPQSNINAEYSLQAVLDTNQLNKQPGENDFKSFNDLNLGFYKGSLWIKLNITNQNNAASFMLINNDLMNRNYRFYKVADSTGQLQPLSFISDTSRQDFRTFEFANPNFKLDLEPNESATFLITTYSDGRWLDATPQLMSMTNFTAFSSQRTASNVIFFSLLFLLLVINVYQWNLVRRKIYFYYIFYMLSTFFMYFGLDGHWYIFGLKHTTVDHIVFISVRLWFLSLLIYTSSFLDTKTIAPRYFKFLKSFLILILGGTTLYQFLFYQSSISSLHFFDNALSFVWLSLILIMVFLSSKKRKTALKYYAIPLLCFFLFILIGLINAHYKVLPGSPFVYIKLGTIIEFTGFTYFIASLIKFSVNKANDYEYKLAKSEKELLNLAKKLEKQPSHNEKTIEKTDLVSAIKLLEHSLSKETDWDEFKLKFEALDPHFFDNLLQTHPNLSKSEIRLLILIKIGYSHKQIAEMLGIEPNSVKKSKTRARKKLSLPSTILLKDYLLEF